jgi:hypothetical protein
MPTHLLLQDPTNVGIRRVSGQGQWHVWQRVGQRHRGGGPMQVGVLGATVAEKQLRVIPTQLFVEFASSALLLLSLSSTMQRCSARLEVRAQLTQSLVTIVEDQH